MSSRNRSADEISPPPDRRVLRIDLRGGLAQASLARLIAAHDAPGCTPRDRCRLANRVGEADRRTRPHRRATSAWPRISRRTRSSIALEKWPETGVPDNPGAWLMATAKHRAIDLAAPRAKLLERKHEQLGHELDAHAGIGGPRSRRRDRRRHRRRSAPARLHRLPPGALDRSAGRADASPARRPHDRRDRARVPGARGDDRAADRAREAHARRGEGAVRGAARRRARGAALVGARRHLPDLQRGLLGDRGRRLDAARALCEDALRLGRILAELAPDEPEVHGLVALMEIQASRLRARAGPSGEPVLLLDQDRARWDQLLIRRGLAALARAEALGGAQRAVRDAGGDRRVSRARAARGGDTDWERIASLYDTLAQSHAIAGRRAESRGGGVDGVRARGRARDRGRAARRSRRSRAITCCRACAAICSRSSAASDEARAELERAASLTRNVRERELLLARAAALGS